MTYRILLVGDSEEQYALSGLHRKDSPFVFVDYTGNFRQGSVADYLGRHDDFDAVAAISNPSYPHTDREILESYEGPVILFGRSHSPNNGQERTNVIRTPFPIMPSEFARIVEELTQ